MESQEILAAIGRLSDKIDAHAKAHSDAIADLRTYVERIEKEANDMMAGMTDPDAMLKMAGKFLGG